MAIVELISEMRAAREFFEWILCGEARVIRGFLKTGETGMPFGPITALCLLKTGLLFDDAHALEAGAAIGLSGRDASDIIGASGNRIEGKDSKPDPYKEWLRRQMIFALGLQPASRRAMSGQAQAGDLENGVESLIHIR